MKFCIFFSISFGELCFGTCFGALSSTGALVVVENGHVRQIVSVVRVLALRLPKLQNMKVCTMSKCKTYNEIEIRMHSNVENCSKIEI